MRKSILDILNVYNKTAMPSATTVVTPERFTQGLTYADFLAQAAVNRDKFEANYQDAPAHRRRHEARRYGVMVPIVVWPDGRVEQAFERNLGCFI